MKRILQRVVGYFQRKPVLEIATDDAFFWGDDVETLKGFARTTLKKLKDLYPQIIFYRPSRTWLTRDENVADWSRMFGAVQFYEVYFLPNGIDLRQLKQTCMQLEQNADGRIGDIDLYSHGRHKISRKDLEQETTR